MRAFHGIAAVLLVAASLGARVPRMHNHLLRATPGIDSTITQAPTEIVLWFAERPDVGLSSIRVRSAQDTTRAVLTGTVVSGTEPNSVKAALTGSLTAGSYIVSYRTAGDDGHVVRGSYRFTLRLP